MRWAAVSVASCVLAAACATVPPPGTHAIRAGVSNVAGAPLELAVQTSRGVLPGAVQPSSLRPGARQIATLFFVPDGEDWEITANGVPMFPASDVNGYVRQACPLFMEIDRGGAGSIGCGSR